MKEKIFSIIAVLFFIPASLYAMGDTPALDYSTEYPVVLVHGMAHDDKFLGVDNYWLNITETLKANGVEVYAADCNAMGKAEYKAIQLAKAVDEYLISVNKTKCHIVAHSHGCVYGRYAIAKYLGNSKVASFTGVAGVHRGTKICSVAMNYLEKLPNQGKDLVGIMDIFCKMTYDDEDFGDPNGNAWSNYHDMTPEYMSTLNPQMPDVDGVYYQTFCGNITKPLKLLAVSGLILTNEGEPINDGLVSSVSARWGNYRGLIPNADWGPGVDHANEINHFLGITPGFDAPKFYLNVVAELKHFEGNGYPRDGFMALAKPSDSDNRNCSDDSSRKLADDLTFAEFMKFGSPLVKPSN